VANSVALIEVKSTASTYDTQFEISQEEWQLAMELHRQGLVAAQAPQGGGQQLGVTTGGPGAGAASDTHAGGAGGALDALAVALAASDMQLQLRGRQLVYVIVRVTCALSKHPRLSRVLPDPAGMYMRGQLQLGAQGSFLLG
jgi:hypothetical protein